MNHAILVSDRHVHPEKATVSLASEAYLHTYFYVRKHFTRGDQNEASTKHQSLTQNASKNDES